jgi:hypothetical protein
VTGPCESGNQPLIENLVTAIIEIIFVIKLRADKIREVLATI